MSCHPKILRPINITVVSGTSVTFVVPAFTPFQGAEYKLIECTCCLEDTTGAEYVYIQPFGEDPINVYDKAGDWLQYKRIRNLKRKSIDTVYGAIPADRMHFTVIENLPSGCFTTATAEA